MRDTPMAIARHRSEWGTAPCLLVQGQVVVARSADNPPAVPAPDRTSSEVDSHALQTPAAQRWTLAAHSKRQLAL